MNDFQPLWALLREHGSSAKRETECPPRLQTLSYADYYARYHTTVTKRRIEAGDTRRRQLIFKEVYASLKKQLSHRERNGSGTRAERGQVLTK